MRVLRNYLVLSGNILLYFCASSLVGLFIMGIISSFGKGI